MAADKTKSAVIGQGVAASLHADYATLPVMADYDGGLREARAAYTTEEARQRGAQDLVLERRRAEEQRIKHAGKAFVVAVREESLELFKSREGYRIDSGRTRLEEDMYRPWEVVVSPAGDVLVITEGKTSEDVLGHYESIFSKGYLVDSNQIIGETHRITNLVIERLARVLEDAGPEETRG